VIGTSSTQTLFDMASEVFRQLGEVPMTMAGGFDVHRQQITFDWVDSDGLVRWGQIRPAMRKTLRAGCRALSGCGRRVRAGGLHRVAVCERGAGRRGRGRASGDPAEIAAAGAEEAR
jgi:transposase